MNLVIGNSSNLLRRSSSSSSSRRRRRRRRGLVVWYSRETAPEKEIDFDCACVACVRACEAACA